MYAIRVKIDDRDDWLYANHDFLVSKKEMNTEKYNHITFKDFMLSKEDADELYLKFILNRDDMRVVALVDISHYEPFPEHAVLKFHEKK